MIGAEKGDRPLGRRRQAEAKCQRHDRKKGQSRTQGRQQDHSEEEQTKGDGGKLRNARSDPGYVATKPATFMNQLPIVPLPQ